MPVVYHVSTAFIVLYDLAVFRFCFICFLGVKINKEETATIPCKNFVVLFCKSIEQAMKTKLSFLSPNGPIPHLQLANIGKASIGQT